MQESQNLFAPVEKKEGKREKLPGQSYANVVAQIISSTPGPQRYKESSFRKLEKNLEEEAALEALLAVDEKKEGREQKEKKSSASKAPETMREKLALAYAPRLVISSLGFPDHHPPIHEVYFTFNEYEKVEESTQNHKSEGIVESKDEKPAPLIQTSKIVSTRQSVSMADIFKPRQQFISVDPPETKTKEKPETETSIRRVLMLGKSGSGKTTASKKFTAAWLDGEGEWSHYNQVFWITLRDMHSISKENLAICAASPFPLAALIHQLCLDKQRQGEIGIKDIDELLKKQPEQTLIILDGFDEVAQAFSEGEPAANPLNTLLTEAFRTNCNLMVTSRDYSLPPSEFQFDRCLINQGFPDTKIMSYIYSYFTTLSKPDKKLAAEVQQLVQRNVQLWSYAHSPLVLSLICDFYFEVRRKNPHAKLENINLVDLYHHTLSIFIRRYLDNRSRWLKEPLLSLAHTKEFGLTELCEKCPIEVDFLETLSFLAIERGEQRFNKSLKEEALAEVCSRTGYPNAENARFINALKLGLLYEFPSPPPHTSSLDETHEFMHLTIQEYLAARYIVKQLEEGDLNWLRLNKYNPKYRGVLNFVCAQMLGKKHAYFWKVLLEEQNDQAGFGHLQLLLYSLEAAQCNADIPELKNHLKIIQKILINCVKANEFEEIIWLQDTLKHCPHVLKCFEKDFWDEIISLLQIKETARQVGFLLSPLMYQTSQLTQEQRKQLLEKFLLAMKDGEYRKEVMANILRSYASQVGQFEIEERNRLFEKLLQILRNKVPYKRNLFANFFGGSSREMYDAVTQALKTYSVQAVQFGFQERTEFLKKLLQAVEKENNDVFKAVSAALQSYSAQIMQLTSEERTQLFTVLLDAMRNPNKHVRNVVLSALDVLSAQAVQLKSDERAKLLRILLLMVGDRDVFKTANKALQSYVVQAVHFNEQEQLLTPLLEALKDKKNQARRNAAAQALKSYSAQAAQFRVEERANFLKKLLECAGNEEDDDLREAAKNALCSYCERVGRFPIQERVQLLKILLTMASAEESYLTRATREALKFYTMQAAQFTPEEYEQLLEKLLRETKNPNENIRYAIFNALKGCATQVTRFLKPEEPLRFKLMDILLHTLKDEKNSNIKEAALHALGAYVSDAAQLSPIEHSAFLHILLQMPVSYLEVKNVLKSYVEQVVKFMPEQHMEVKDVLKSYIEQVVKFMPEQRNQWLKKLLEAVDDPNEHVRYLATHALGVCGAQPAQFTPEERTRLLDGLLKVARGSNSWLSGIAFESLRECSKQAARFTFDQRNMLLRVFLEKIGDGNEYEMAAIMRKIYTAHAQAAEIEPGQLLRKLWEAVDKATDNIKGWQKKGKVVKNIYSIVKISLLLFYGARMTEFTSQERINFLRLLMESIKNENYTLQNIFSMLEACSSYPQFIADFLKTPYSESYAALQTLLSENWLFPNVSLDQLLNAYFLDEAKSTFFMYPRRALWLQFVVKRALADGVSLVFDENECRLYGAQFSRPLSVSIRESKNRVSLTKQLTDELALQASALSVPVAIRKPQLPLPLPNEQKRQTAPPSVDKKPLEDIQPKTDKTDEKFAQIAQRLSQLETQMSENKTTLIQHEATLKRHEEIWRDHQERFNALETRMTKLDKEWIAKADAVRAEIEALKGDVKLVVTKCEHLSDNFIEEIAKFEEKEKQWVVDYRQQYEKLQSEQARLQNSLQDLAEKISALEKANPHSIEELAKLQAMMPMLQKMKTQYEDQEKRLKEREKLFHDPKIAEFYRVMHTRLIGFYLVCTIAATGLVKIESNENLKEKVAKLLVGTLGDNIPIPGAKSAAKFINGMIEWHRKYREEEERTTAITRSPLLIADKEIAIELAIQEIIHRYMQQIRAVKGSAIQTLALCAVNRIVHGVKTSDKEVDDAKAVSSEYDFPTQLANWLHHPLEKGEDGFAHKTIDVESGVLPNERKEVGFVQKIKKEAKELMGKNIVWTEDGIFRLTGIYTLSSTQKIAFYFYEDISDDPNHELCDCRLYGFRYIENFDTACKEKERQRLDKHSENDPPLGSWQFIAPQTQPVLKTPGKLSILSSGISSVAQSQAPDVALQVYEAHGDSLKKTLKNFASSAAQQMKEKLEDGIGNGM